MPCSSLQVCQPSVTRDSFSFCLQELFPTSQKLNSPLSMTMESVGPKPRRAKLSMRATGPHLFSQSIWLGQSGVPSYTRRSKLCSIWVCFSIACATHRAQRAPARGPQKFHEICFSKLGQAAAQSVLSLLHVLRPVRAAVRNVFESLASGFRHI